jgi:hypothetical protein
LDGEAVTTAARSAIDLATEVIRIGQERGLVKSMPDTDELNVPTKLHVRRNVRAQVLSQAAGQEIARQEAARVQVAALDVVPNGGKHQ